MNFRELNITEIKKTATEMASKISTETVGWLAIVLLHAATVPSLLAVMQGLTDVMLPVDMVVLVWSALVLMFLRAAIMKDTLNLITIGLGFFVQATMMALIFFK
jgi:hypothetical protein